MHTDEKERTAENIRKKHEVNLQTKKTNIHTPKTHTIIRTEKK